MRIDRRRFIGGLAGAGAAAAIGAPRRDAAAQRTARRPNVLFIITDQQRLDAMRCYGNPHISTPNLDRLAGEGVRFDRYYIAGFPCSPSRGCILTGLHPQRHGITTNGVKLDEELPTFATELTRAGYQTSWMGKWHMGGPQESVPGSGSQLPALQKMTTPPPGEKMPQNGFVHGVSPNSDYVAYLRELGLEEPIPGQKVRGGHHTVIVDGASVIPKEHFVETFLTDSAIDYLKQHGADDDPFCLCVSYEGPHRPMNPPKPWDTMYDPESLPLPKSVDDPMTSAPETHQNFHWRMNDVDMEAERDKLKRQLVFPGEMWDLLDRDEWGEREYRELMAHYYGFMSYIDHQIGRLLDSLDDLGLAADTLVVFTTDHGEYMGGHGNIFKHMAMHEELMHVPLVARLPGAIPADRVTQALSSSVDIMPTLLDYGGADTPESVHGKSLRPVLEGETDDQHEAVYTSFPAPGVQMRMVRTTDDWKYSLNWRPRQVDELYDLSADPLEMENLSGQPEHARREKRMRRLVYSFMREIDDPWRHAARFAVERPPLTDIDFDFTERYDELYWQYFRGLGQIRIEDGVLAGHIACPGYMTATLDEPVSGADYPVLEIAMSVTAGE
ncbi:MAG TPA: sulfatase-like hydrolase/transferase, partial [Armatimonadota bacterium]|nr:sulfatase-like hydrolase/transferase [Armatimonadota bacterium]